MEKRKSNKKLFAIIGGSVLAFVLTIALSVSITLAYFGGEDSRTSTLRMSGTVEVNDTATETTVINGVLPGEVVNYTGSFVVSSDNSQTTGVEKTPAFLRMKFTNNADEELFAEDSAFVVDNTSAPITGAKWILLDDGYFYLVATAETATDNTAKLFKIETTTDATVNYAITATINPLLDNTWAGTEVTLGVEVTAIQGELNIDGTMTSVVTIAQAQAAFTAVEGDSQVSKS